MSKLSNIQASIFQLLKSQLSNVCPKVPSDFNFKSKIAIEYKVGEVITNKVYRKDYTLEIQVTGLWDKMLEIQDIAEKIEVLINKRVVSNYRIIENNPRTSFNDGDKHTIVLQYLCVAF